MCTTLNVIGVGLIVVTITSDVDADLCILIENVVDYLKRKEQHKVKNTIHLL